MSLLSKVRATALFQSFHGRLPGKVAGSGSSGGTVRRIAPSGGAYYNGNYYPGGSYYYTPSGSSAASGIASTIGSHPLLIAGIAIGAAVLLSGLSKS